MTLSWQRVAPGAQGQQISELASLDPSWGWGWGLCPRAELVISHRSQQLLEDVRSVQHVHKEGGSS